MDKIKKLQTILKNSQNVVFFGGAGVSTESGLPDFRSNKGLYNKKNNIPPETILSHNFFYQNPKEFYNYYFNKLFNLNVKPNDAHYQLAKWEKQGKIKAIITQNIDGLHQQAGSKIVYELHGSIHRNYCLKCHKFYSSEELIKQKNNNGIPICNCQNLIKPDVVLYGENLNENTINNSIKAIINCDTLIVAGTSLTVYPAAGLINYFHGKNLILINKEKTPFDDKATLTINDSVVKALKQIKLITI